MGRISLALAVGTALALGTPAAAEAAAFALVEHGVSGLGNAYAGAAAVAEDASTVWWNPAGMARLPAGRHLALAGGLVMPSTKFRDRGSIPALGRPPGGSGGDAGDSALVPSAFFVMDLGPRWRFGVGLSVPFGLRTEYDADWIGRFQGIASELRTLNVNPSISYRVSDALSVGVGLNYQRAEIETLTAVNFVAAEGLNRLEVDGDAWGFNAGVLFDLAPGTRLGVHYRSAIDYALTGTTRFTAPAPPAATSGARLDVKTPAAAAVSVAHRLNPRWELLADVTWWQWSNIGTVPVVRTDGPQAGQTAGAFVFNFDDAWRVSVGANYRMSEGWMLRAGAALDRTPVPDAESRTVRLPDSDRYWFSAGAKHRLSRAGALDFAYTFIRARDADIAQDQRTATPPAGLVLGTYRARVHILGVQYQHSF